MSIIVKDIVSDIVSSIKKSRAITAINDNGDGTYTVLTTNTYYLQDGFYVTISGTVYFNGDYQISNVVEDTSFTITKTSGLASETGVWTAKNPYFYSGHVVEVIKELTKKDRQEPYRFEKYPMIMLVHDFEETVHDYYIETSLRLVVANLTRADYLASERYTYNFKPILYPIYEDLTQAFLNSHYTWKGESTEYSNISHTKTDRLYWGVQSPFRVGGTIMNDRLDAIDIQNFNWFINKNPKQC